MKTFAAPAVLAAVLAVTAPFTAFAAPATISIQVGTTVSLGDALVDVIGAFEAYWYEQGVDYDVGFTSDTNAHLRKSVVQGAGAYDLILTDERALAWELGAKDPSKVLGDPFVFASDRLDLYAVSVDVSKTGLKPRFGGPLVVADPTSDAYGAATARLLAGAPWMIHTLPNGRVDVQPDITVVEAAVELGLNPYGILAKSRICRNPYGKEIYPEGTYHYEFQPLDGLRYHPIEPSGIATASSTRTPEQSTELAAFMDFVRGVGTTQGQDVLRSYCYRIPR